jgi:methionyl-tRNA formyltransferase
MNTSIKFVFFGSSRLSVIVLDELEKLGLLPVLVVTTPDKPQGRKLQVMPNVVKQWALSKNIPVIDSLSLLKAGPQAADVFIVASYGRIIPKEIINMPARKTLNIHPSLLPKYRGPSPLPSAMLDDTKDTGISIMRLDEEMDHGPIVAQKAIHMNEWPTYEDFEEMMAREGSQLLASILPDWTAGKISEKEQDHSQATYTKKIIKENGLLDLNADQYLNFRKIQAYHEWPQAYFMHKDKRVKVTQASFKDGKLIIEKVIPEGKKEMSYKDFQSGFSH